MATQKVDFDVLAHDKASDKLDRIARSFRKLKSDSDNIDGDGLTDLSQKLRKVADDFEKEGDRSGKKFGSGLKKWLTGSGANLGKEGGTVFGSGFLGALKTPILGPAIIAGLGGAVALAAPAVGAIAASGITAGFGAGIAGLGIVFAAKSEVVKREWSSTLDAMASDMRRLSQPFESTLTAMAGVARRTFNRFAPELEAASKQMAPALSVFGDQLGRAFEGLAPAIRPLSEAFTAVLQSLGPAMQSAIGKVSQGLQELAASVKQSPDGLADLTEGLGDVSQEALGLITTLNNINASFRNVTDGTSAVDVVMTSLAGAVKGSELALQGITAPVTGLEAVMVKLGLRTKDTGAATNSFSGGLLKTAGALSVTIGPVQAVADAAGRLRQQFSSAITAMGQWKTIAINSSNAAIAYQAAIDAASESVKANGRTLNINTEKGRANRTALNQIAEAANRQIEAMDAAGASNVSVARTADSSRANFIKLARQMGATKPQAEAMARSMLNIPNVSREAKLTANKKDLEKKLRDAQTALKNPNLTKARTAALKADIRNAQRGIATVNGLLGRLPRSRTVTLTTRHVTERIVRNQSGASGGRLPGFALGGPVKKDQPIIVGDGGRPEVFVPHSDGTILPKVPPSGTGTPLGGGSGSGGGGDVHIHLHGTEQQLMDQLVRKLDDLRRQGRLRVA